MREDDLTIRKFREADADIVSNIIRQNLIQKNSKDYSEQVINNMCELYTPKYIRTISNKRKLYIALKDDEIVGIAGIDYDTIYTVFIDVRYHGKGIGEKLIGLMEEIAANNGFKVVKLDASITAQSFYKRLGYSVVTETESEQFGKAINMEKYLV